MQHSAQEQDDPKAAVRWASRTAQKNAEQTVRALLRLSEKLHATLELEALLDALVLESIALVGAEGGCAGWRTAEGLASRRYFRDGKSEDFEYFWRPGQ